MADIFDEVDEALKEDVFKSYWIKYKYLIFGTVAAVLIGASGYSIYKNVDTARSEKWTAALIDQINDKDNETLKTEQPPAPFSTLSALIDINKGADSATDLKTVIESLPETSQLKKPLIIRAMYENFEQTESETLKAELAQFDQAKSAYRHAVRELLALNAYREKDWQEVKTLTDQVIEDTEAPSGLSQRMQALSAIAKTELASSPEAKTSAAPASAE